MSTFKRKKVVMLPTKKAENCLYLSSNRLNYHKGYLTQDYLKNSINAKSYHLYIISDKKIKEGWILGLDNKPYFIEEEGTYQVVIATTDNSLRIFGGYGTGDTPDEAAVYERLPQPSESFIKVFIEEYNKGNIITDILVEYVKYYRDLSGKHEALMLNGSEFDELKVNPKDNTITIRKIKDTYSKKEVENLLRKLYFEATGESTGHPDGFCQKFIDKNL